MKKLRHSDKRYKCLIRKQKAIRKLKQELIYLIYYYYPKTFLKRNKDNY